ncbi:MAG TPA: sodium ion-translocating decarboxylase subunit beta [Acetivibrio sp.]|nr:sodium ion-translocating decarboxylase subunit beta [Acetivibrio sp.]
MFSDFINSIKYLISDSGFVKGNPLQFVMILLACFLIYLAIGKKYEPLLLLPIAFGMLLTNLPFAELYHPELFINESGHINIQELIDKGGLLDFLYLGVKLGIYPPLIFLGIGAMTDFGPLLANPKSLLLGAAAQIGIFLTLIGALLTGFFTPAEAGAIGIIGGADGPTAIYVTTRLAPHLLGPIAIAAYSYMALVPLIQPPIMKLLTTKKEREVVMEQLRPVSKLEKIMFPIVVTVIVCLFLPSAAPLVGMMMLGNLFKESGVVERINKTAQNELLNIITIFLGVTVGATATAENFLNIKTLSIIGLGLVAFSFGTAFGVLFGKLMYYLTGGKVNPLIGSAGVSAVPMAARVSQKVGQEANPSNFLLMHAMGPNVAGVIGSAIAAGVLLSILQ